MYIGVTSKTSNYQDDKLGFCQKSGKIVLIFFSPYNTVFIRDLVIPKSSHWGYVLVTYERIIFDYF